MQKVSILKLYLIFVKIGAILLGGGYVILPIITDELCKKRKLLSEDEVLNYYTLSQTLPGIVAANISMFTGYKLGGKFGAVSAMLGIITFPFWAIVLLASILDSLAQNTYVQGIMWGIGIAVIALIMLTVRELWQKSERNLFFYGIFLASLISLLIFEFSPIKTIILFTIIGILWKRGMK